MVGGGWMFAKAASAIWALVGDLWGQTTIASSSSF